MLTNEGKIKNVNNVSLVIDRDKINAFFNVSVEVVNGDLFFSMFRLKVVYETFHQRK